MLLSVLHLVFLFLQTLQGEGELDPLLVVFKNRCFRNFKLIKFIKLCSNRLCL